MFCHPAFYSGFSVNTNDERFKQVTMHACLSVCLSTCYIAPQFRSVHTAYQPADCSIAPKDTCCPAPSGNPITPSPRGTGMWSLDRNGQQVCAVSLPALRKARRGIFIRQEGDFLVSRTSILALWHNRLIFPGDQAAGA